MSHEIPKQEMPEGPLTREEMEELGVEEGDISYFFKVPAYDDKGERVLDHEGKPGFRVHHFMKIMGKDEIKKAILRRKKELGLI